MAVRIQLRRDTAANWTSSNPVLRAGEIGIETDTLKIKIGNGTSTWTQITTYANVTPSGLSSSLGSYILSADQGNPGGPAELDSNGDLVVPENSVILWNDAAYTYSTTLTATEPTADRTITFKNADGTVAFTSDIPSNTDSLSEGTTNKYFTDERAQDAISTALAAGTHTNITVTYNDNANSISLAAAPGYVDEQAVDAVAAALAAGTHTNLTVTYDDNANSISLNASGGVSSLTGTTNEVEVSTSTGAVTVGLPNDVTIANNLTVTGDITAADSLQLTTNAGEASGIGKLIWDDGEGIPTIGLKGGNVDLKLGSQEVTLCYNGTGSTIAKGSVVYISGAQGQRPRISLSDADTEATSSKTFGVVAESIADGAEGFVTTFGIVSGINTSTFTAGDALWLSSTAGGLTATKPSAPTHSVFVGYCLSSNLSSGRIFVNPQNGYELQEIHNVAISSVANDDVLKYDSALGVWKNTKTLSITDLTLSGNLTVNGTTTTVNATDLVVSDPLIYIGEGNTANSVDLGFVASYNNGTYQHTGLVRDSSDNKWKLFKGVTDEPTTTINFAQGTLDALAVLSLEGNVTGNLTGNVTGNVTGNLTGNADTVTNGVYTTGTYADPSWITSLAKSKVGLGNVENTALSTWAGSTNLTTLGTIATGTWEGTKIDAAHGGTGNTSYVAGDILYASNTSTLSTLGIGTEGYLLTATTSGPAWAAAPVSLPSQTGNSGEYLTTDGTTASWAAIPVTSAASPSSAGTVLGLTSTSSDNTALGHGPLTSLTTGTYNTAVGKNALLALTSGNANTALGLGALKSNTSGSDNTALGLEALWSNLNGQYNVAVGRNAMQLNSSGGGNVVIGYQSLYRNTSGNNNTVVGSQAAGYVTGNQNTVLGAVAAYSGTNDLTSGSNNIVVGYNASASSAGISNEITLGNSSITRFRIPGIGLDFGKTATLTANTATVVDTTNLSVFTSAEYTVSLKQGSKIRTSKVIVQTDGTSVDMTEFAITETGGTISGVVVSAAASIGTADLQITVTDAATTNVTVKLSKVVL